MDRLEVLRQDLKHSANRWETKKRGKRDLEAIVAYWYAYPTMLEMIRDQEKGSDHPVLSALIRMERVAARALAEEVDRCGLDAGLIYQGARMRLMVCGTDKYLPGAPGNWEVLLEDSQGKLVKLPYRFLAGLYYLYAEYAGWPDCLGMDFAQFWGAAEGGDGGLYYTPEIVEATERVIAHFVVKKGLRSPGCYAFQGDEILTVKVRGRDGQKKPQQRIKEYRRQGQNYSVPMSLVEMASRLGNMDVRKFKNIAEKHWGLRRFTFKTWTLCLDLLDDNTRRKIEQGR